VVFGDIQAEAGEEQVKKLATPNVKFVKTDVTKYDDLLALFDVALKHFGKVDCAISNAAIPEVGNFVNPDLSLESVREVSHVSNLWMYLTYLDQVTNHANSRCEPFRNTLLFQDCGSLSSAWIDCRR
jgi:NAD(P)-dependent dehydrogenase (short-subunit alcohol dehydrogenase family)